MEVLDAEIYWVEVTDREDVGSDLRAPLLGESGKPQWRYTLFQRAQPGDVVFHYDTAASPKGIRGRSVVAGPPYKETIVWGARGTYARAANVKPEQKPGYRVPLRDFEQLDPPVTTADLEELRPALREVEQNLRKKHGSIYFPFNLSPKVSMQAAQGYAFKMPRAVVELFPQLGGTPRPLLPEELTNSQHVEGASKTIRVNRYERDRVARDKCIAHYGTSCAVCGFDFESRYGQLGRGFTHVHHLVPLAEIGVEYTVDPIEDLRPVCPNCHAMLHRGSGPVMSIDELRQLMQSLPKGES